MPVALNYVVEKKENDILLKSLRDIIALKTDENWNIKAESIIEDYIAAYNKNENVKIACFDVTPDGAIDTLCQIRENKNDPKLVIIADGTVSPVKYLRPSIMASSLLLKPLDEKHVSECIHEIISTIYSKDESDENNKLMIEANGEKKLFDFNDIYYFEAREKRIFLNTKYNETGFYSTLDSVAEKLPKSFIRCHRSFIVNKNKITRIVLQEGLIYCGDDILVPISRSNKKAVVDAIKEKKQ